jgi:hypothetical protein
VPSDLVRRHLRLGWWCLLVFLTLGLLLESLQGFKIGFYMDLANATRRHVWTLAHAHGTLLGLVNLAFAMSLKLFGDGRESWTGLASAALVGATILLPGGFLLGGVVVYAGDPGLGVLLVPVGGALLVVAVFLAARGFSSREPRGGAS